MQPGTSNRPTTPAAPIGEPLGTAIQSALDGLLVALELEPIGEDRFRVASEPGRFDRVFGGQFVAQALLAACATVEGTAPHSLHAYFVEASAPEQPLELAVERIRDGRSISTRRVTVSQDGRTLLAVLASFHSGPDTPEASDPPPEAPAPHLVPLLQDWARDMPADRAEHGRSWVERPPPLELRIPEPPNFLGGPAGRSERPLWVRVPRDVGDDPVRHAALLAYASDYLLLDMVPRAHPDRSLGEMYSGFSLDHAIWFHRPVRFDRWHLHTMHAQAISGHRGLVRGTIHDEEGRLVASVMQEVLVRPPRPSGGST